MLKFDVVFVDTGPMTYYDRKTLETQALGGTEATIIRIAEALGALKLDVAVIKATDPANPNKSPYHEPIMGQYAMFMHEYDMPSIEARFAVFLRGPALIAELKAEKRFIWCHDLGSDKMQNWQSILNEYQPKILAVSQWHRDNLLKHSGEYKNIDYIYNPIEEHLYDHKRTTCNKNLMVWASSPHKGLEEALGVLKELKKDLPNIQLLVFNPGYIKIDPIINPGVLFYGPTNCKNVWHNLKKALCMFYPSQYEETFGLCMAEANALGVPIATYANGALREVLSEGNPIAKTQQDIIEQIKEWYINGPPEIKGRDEFRTKKIALDWLRMLSK